MSQTTHQDHSPGTNGALGTQTLFLATRQELLEHIDRLTTYASRDAGSPTGFSGKQRFTWRKSQ